MRTRKRTLRPKRSRCCCRGTLRPRRGRHAAAVVQKTIKKLIPRSAGLLLLILFSVKLERERKLRSLDFELVAIFATHSSSKRSCFSPPLRPLDRTKEYERTTRRRRFEESTTATRFGLRQEAGSTPLGRVEVVFGRARLAPFSSSSSNQVIAATVKGSPEEAEKIRPCIYHVHVCASIAYFNVYSVQSFPVCEFPCFE